LLYIEIIGFAIPAVILLIEIIIKIRDNNYKFNKQIYIVLLICSFFILAFTISITFIYYNVGTMLFLLLFVLFVEFAIEK